MSAVSPTTSVAVVAGAPQPTAWVPRLARAAATFVAIFSVCLLITFHDGRGSSFDAQHVAADARISQVLPKLGNEDPRHYLKVGYDIAQYHRVPGQDRVFVNRWPPGMHVYYAALFTVFGPEMPVGVVAGTAMAVLWAVLLTAYVDLLLRFVRAAAVAALIVVVLLSDIVRVWILGPGLFWSEGLYTWWVLLALYAAVRSATARSDGTRLGWAVGVGAALGLSAYVRTVSDFLGWLMVALLFGWGTLTLLRLAVRRWRVASGGPASEPRSRLSRQLLTLLLCVIAFEMVTVPWRVYAAQSLRPGNYTWSTATNAYWHDAWTPDNVLIARSQQWLVDGGANTACEVDAKTCRRIARYERRQVVPYSGLGRYTESRYRRLAVQAFANHPAEYTAARLTSFGAAWFWYPAFDRPVEIVQNAILGLAVIGALVLSIRRALKAGPDLLALLYPGLFVATMVPFVFLHYEARYFVTIKLVAVVLVFVLLAAQPTFGGSDVRAGHRGFRVTTSYRH